MEKLRIGIQGDLYNKKYKRFWKETGLKPAASAYSNLAFLNRYFKGSPPPQKKTQQIKQHLIFQL